MAVSSNNETKLRMCFSSFLSIYLFHCNIKGNVVLKDQPSQLKLFSDAFYLPYEKVGICGQKDGSACSKIVSGLDLFSVLLPQNRYAETDGTEFVKTFGYFVTHVFVHFPNEDASSRFVEKLCGLIVADSYFTDKIVIDSMYQTKRGDLNSQITIHKESFIVTLFLYIARQNFKFGNTSEKNSHKKAIESFIGTPTEKGLNLKIVSTDASSINYLTLKVTAPRDKDVGVGMSIAHEHRLDLSDDFVHVTDEKKQVEEKLRRIDFLERSIRADILSVLVTRDPKSYTNSLSQAVSLVERFTESLKRLHSTSCNDAIKSELTDLIMSRSEKMIYYYKTVVARMNVLLSSHMSDHNSSTDFSFDNIVDSLQSVAFE